MNAMNPVLSINSLPLNGFNKHYKSDINLFNRWLSGREVKPDLFMEYFTELRETHYFKCETLKRKKTALRLSWIKSLGNISEFQKAVIETMFRKIKTGTKEKGVADEKILTQWELVEIIRLSGRKTSLIIQSLYETAGRVSELTNIRLENCHVDGESVIIQIIGKGSKEGKFFMSLDLFNEINEAYKGQTYLFENLKTGKPITRFAIYNMVKNAGQKLAKKTGKHKKISPHSLRHSWASINVNTLGVAKTSKYLRHSKISTTTDFYVHVKPSVSEIAESNRQTLAC